MKYFSLKTNWYTYGYDTQVVPLLNRMLNLEELTLYISVIRTESNYIDGNQLYDEVLNNMSQLKKFIFNIHTHIINYHTEINPLSTDVIQNSFIRRRIQSFAIFADNKLINNITHTHIEVIIRAFSRARQDLPGELCIHVEELI